MGAEKEINAAVGVHGFVDTRGHVRQGALVLHHCSDVLVRDRRNAAVVLPRLEYRTSLFHEVHALAHHWAELCVACKAHVLVNARVPQMLYRHLYPLSAK